MDREDRVPAPSQTHYGSLDGTSRSSGMSLSMHDGVEVWCDCCSCEAEPYWVEVAQALGIDLGGDYEDEDTQSRRDD